MSVDTQWMVDAMVHQVPPSLAETRAPSLPRTGAQLVAWRKEKGWTQRRVAEALGVSIKTVKRSEAQPNATLSTSIIRTIGKLKVEKRLEISVPEPIGTIDLKE